MKKYFWLKLHRDYFKRHDIRYIESLPNGKNISLLYLKLLVESIDHEGKLRFSASMPYTSKMLAVVTDTDEAVIDESLQVLMELGLLEILDDGTMYLPGIENMIGTETAAAERKRVSRANRTCDIVTPESQKCHTEKEIEQEKDKDKKIYLEKEREKDIF